MESPAPRPSEEAPGWLLTAVPPALLVLIGALLVGAGGHDDSHVTYGSVVALLERGALNYNGELVEQSSSLLHVLLLAALAVTGIPIPTLGVLSSVVFGVAAVLAVQRLAARVDPALVLPAGVLTATQVYFVYWSFGGLETTIAAFGAVWLLLEAVRFVGGNPPPWRVLGALGFVLLARPEAPFVCASLFGGMAALALFSRERGQARRFGMLLGYTAVLGLLVAGARLAVFGEPFPQPVAAKTGAPLGEALAAGAAYLDEWLLASIPVALLFATAAFGAWTALARGGAALRLCAGFVGVTAAFVLFAGGDWMEGGRFLVPALPAVALLAASALRSLPAPNAAFAAAVLLNVASVPLLETVSYGDAAATARRSVLTETFRVVRAPDERPLLAAADLASPPVAFTASERINRLHRRDIPTIIVLDRVVGALADSLRRPVVVLSGQMGMVSYHVAARHGAAVTFVDRHGLTDRHLSRCEAARGRADYFGMNVSVHRYFRLLQSSGCDLPPPDVVFDIWPHRFLDGLPEDYEVVYLADGLLVPEGMGRPAGAGSFVAVEGGLLPALRHGWPVEVGTRF